jgi:hypothetical protein
MGFLDPARRVNLVAEDHEATQAARTGADRDPDRRQDVGRPVRPAMVGLRMAPVTTTGASVSSNRSRA